MCGIVGYIGKKKAYPILIKGLQRLEYRGYDSAGVAMIDDKGGLNVYKAKGKVADLMAFCEDKDISGSAGIAHTRWATHGEPNSANAHPHYSASGRLALIHNGIIENYATIKENLVARGIQFKSVTDTEVLVQLIEHIMLSNDLPLLEAVQVALRQVIGAYAIAILDREHPDTIICARQSSPLVVGLGADGNFFLASDASPIAEYTDKVVYLNDGDIAVLQLGEELKVVNVDNEEQHPKVKQIDVTIGQLEKGGYPFFMLKEIFEQPDSCATVCEAVSTWMATTSPSVLSSITVRSLQALAASSSWHVAQAGTQVSSASSSSRTCAAYPSRWSTPQSSVTATPSSILMMW